MAEQQGNTCFGQLQFPKALTTLSINQEHAQPLFNELVFAFICTSIFTGGGKNKAECSLPSTNPGDPPGSTRGPHHVTVQSPGAAPLPSPAPEQHQGPPHAAPGPLRAGVLKQHQHLLRKQHHERLFEAEQQREMRLVVSVPGGHGQGRGRGREEGG